MMSCVARGIFRGLYDLWQGVCQCKEHGTAHGVSTHEDAPIRLQLLL